MENKKENWKIWDEDREYGEIKKRIGKYGTKIENMGRDFITELRVIYQKWRAQRHLQNF